MKTDELWQQATARPWEAWHGRVLDSCGIDIGVFETHASVNADVAVLAVNTFEQAREALRAVLECQLSAPDENTIDKVEAALAAMEGESE